MSRDNENILPVLNPFQANRNPRCFRLILGTDFKLEIVWEYYRDILKKEIEKCEADLARADEIEKNAKYILDNKCSSENRWLMDLWVEALFLYPLREGRLEKIKKYSFWLTSKKSNKNDAQNSNIERAKSVLVSDIIKINHSGFAICPLHSERTASFKYYPKTNSWYCFSCNEGGDVIKLVMLMEKVGFIEAVKYLNK